MVSCKLLHGLTATTGSKRRSESASCPTATNAEACQRSCKSWIHSAIRSLGNNANEHQWRGSLLSFRSRSAAAARDTGSFRFQ